MAEALPAVRRRLSLGKGSKQYGVPKQTLSDKISKKCKTNKPGRPTDLIDAEENALVKYIHYMALIAHPLSVAAIKLFAWNISKRSGKSRF